MTPLKIAAADLAALRFRAVDALDRACSRLEGRALDEGETLRIVLTASVVRNAQGNLIFGEMDGVAQHV